MQLLKSCKSMNIKKFVFILSFLCFIAITNSLQAQFILKSNGNLRIGPQASPTDAKLLVTGFDETELKVFSLSNTIARLWAMNSKYAYGLGVDENGYGHIYKNVNSVYSIMTFNTAGKIGISRNPSYQLDVNGNVRGNSFILYSGNLSKSNVKPIESAKDNLLKLMCISYVLNECQLDYNKNNESLEENQKKHYGFLAQEVNELFPELVYEDDSGAYSIDYISFIPLMLAEIKQQHETIKSLKLELEYLKSIEKNKVITISNDNLGELYQNFPNPFYQNTKIEFRVYDKSKNAILNVYDMYGRMVKSYPLNNMTDYIMINGNELRSGMYMYSLLVDNVLVDTKIMILTE